MNQWDFVIAAYGVSVPALGWLVLVSFNQMRRAEQAVDEMMRGRK